MPIRKRRPAVEQHTRKAATSLLNAASALSPGKATLSNFEKAAANLSKAISHIDKLDFTHFKRHKRGNLQYAGTEWRGVSVHRSWRSIVKNPPTPTTSGYAQR